MTNFNDWYTQTPKNHPATRICLEAEMRKAYEAGAASQSETLRDKHVDQAINEIDAAIFSGDSLNDINAALRFQKWLHRWERGLLKKFTPEGHVADYDPSAY